MNYYIIGLVLAITSGVCWRMGGADDYEKLWRRVGSSACMICCLPFVQAYTYAIACLMVIWGAVSYFGWVNNIVKLFWKDIEMDSEYVWNFFIENLMIQGSVVVIKQTPISAVLAVLFAAISAFGKVWIDSDKDGYILEWRKDVVSEFWHGFSNCLFIAVNTLI